jgi:hypothetical protein
VGVAAQEDFIAQIWTRVREESVKQKLRFLPCYCGDLDFFGCEFSPFYIRKEYSIISFFYKKVAKK